MKLTRRKKRLQDTVELNITAFMNLMVILVPFLLITAVFSRMTVIELNLPALNVKEKHEDKIKLQLQLVIRQNRFDIQDENLGLIRTFERKEGNTDWKKFTDILVEIKSRFPEVTTISLLLEPSVSYKTLIRVMDRVRSADVVQMTSLKSIELFPDISIGDAPEISSTPQLEPVDVKVSEPSTVTTGLAS